LLGVFALCLGFNAAAQDRYLMPYYTEAKTLNYFLLLDSTSQSVAANTQDGLVENDRYGRFVPCLASSWTVSPDSKVWTFKLRKGQKWVNGKGAETRYEITADDFVEGLRYVADPKNGIKNVSSIRKLVAGLNDYYYDLLDIDDGKDIGKTRAQVLARFDSAVGVKALDPYTLQYTLAKSTPYFLSYAVTELFFPVEKSFMDSVGAADFGTSLDKLLFSGAYYLSDWQRDKRLVLSRNEHNWDCGRVSIKKISMQKISDPLVSLQMFQRGELSSTSLQADQVKALAGSKWAAYVYPAESSSVTYWFIQNFTSSNPEAKAFINNENFRKALYWGIDRKKLMELYDPYRPASLLRNTVVPEETIFDEKGRDYTDYAALKPYKDSGEHYDAAKARKYFAAAVAELTDGKGAIKGVTPGVVDMKPIAEVKVDGRLPVQLLYVHSNDATDTKMALLLKAMLKDLFGPEGVDLQLGQFVDDKYNEVVKPRRFDLTYDSFRFSFADPMAQLGRLVTEGGVNDGQFSDPEFDKLIADADAKSRISDRYAAFSKAEALFLDRAYILPLQMGGGAYTMSKMLPFSYPRGGFGTTRFKFKGAVVQKEPVTLARYNELRAKFYAELDAISKK
jgi:oligopeptide transport system substrate-binding protein